MANDETIKPISESASLTDSRQQASDNAPASDNTPDIPDIPEIPTDPVTDEYPLLAHLADEDDETRLNAFTQVHEQLRGELNRLSTPHDQSGSGHAHSNPQTASHTPSHTISHAQGRRS